MKKGDSVFKIVISVAILISIIVIGFYFYQFAKEPLSSENGIWGQFGDYIGGTLNPVFGFLSLIVLLLVYIQNKEELEDTRKILAEQSETLKVQRFEQTFFSLVGLYSNIINDFEFSKIFTAPYKSTNYNGRKAIEKLYFELKMYLQKEECEPYEPDNGVRVVCVEAYCNLADFDKQFLLFEDLHAKHLMHYFRTIYHILKFVDTANIADKQTYINLFRAQLSTAEIILIFYNGMSSFGREKMLPLMLKYDLLQHIDYGLLCNKEIDLRIFEELKQNIK